MSNTIVKPVPGHIQEISQPDLTGQQDPLGLGQSRTTTHTPHSGGDTMTNARFFAKIVFCWAIGFFATIGVGETIFHAGEHSHRQTAEHRQSDAALIGHDSDGHRTLNKVALGVPLDDAMPACEGDPQNATELCHTPLTRPFATSSELNADVYGFPVRKDASGNPSVTTMKVTTKLDSTVIKDVTAYTTRESAYETFLQTSQALGAPDRVDDYYTSWYLSHGQTVLLNATFVSIYIN
ncbi:hypothetical protein [Burkholderia cepacia]|uniref:hypothetical protein n=1 Tax=Burkholderia cepacia TaxID=292 RepID=UPI003EE2F5CF